MKLIMLSREEAELEDMLDNLLAKVQSETLTCREKLLLVDLFIQLQEDVPDSFSEEEMLRYALLGWYVRISMERP